MARTNGSGRGGADIEILTHHRFKHDYVRVGKRGRNKESGHKGLISNLQLNHRFKDDYVRVYER